MKSKYEQHKFQNLEELEELTKLGGFIEEKITNQIYDAYPTAILEAVLNYRDIGNDVCYIASRINDEASNADFVYMEADFSRIPRNSFQEWYVNTAARLIVEELDHPQKIKWWKDSRLRISARLKNSLEILGIVEQRVAYYVAKNGGFSFYCVDEIVDHLDENCKADYILNICEIIEDVLDTRNCKDEFDALFDEIDLENFEKTEDNQ